MDSSFVGWRHPAAAAAAAEGGALLSPQKQRRRQSEFYLILLLSRSRLFVGPSLPPSRGQCLLLLLLRFWRDQMGVCVCVHARFVPRKMVLSLSLSFPPPNNARVGRPRKRDEQWRECYITRVLRPGLRGGVAEGGRRNRFVVAVSHIWSHVPGLCPFNESFSYSPISN